jgi:hypothetical protein
MLDRFLCQSYSRTDRCRVRIDVAGNEKNRSFGPMPVNNPDMGTGERSSKLRICHAHFNANRRSPSPPAVCLANADASSPSNRRSRWRRTSFRPGLERPRRRSRSTVTSAETALYAGPPGPSGCDQNARKRRSSACRDSRYRAASSASLTLVTATTQRAKSGPTGLLVSPHGQTPAQPISTESNRVL